MTSIRFNPISDLILLSMKVEGVTKSDFRDVLVALDTGASATSIPTKTALDLGYDPYRPKYYKEIITGTQVENIPVIEVTKITAIGQPVENIDVLCYDLPQELRVAGVLGLDFISKFNINISFAKGIIDIEPHDGYEEWITF